jgi:hypothetical protein
LCFFFWTLYLWLNHHHQREPTLFMCLRKQFSQTGIWTLSQLRTLTVLGFAWLISKAQTPSSVCIENHKIQCRFSSLSFMSVIWRLPVSILFWSAVQSKNANFPIRVSYQSEIFQTHNSWKYNFLLLWKFFSALYCQITLVPSGAHPCKVVCFFFSRWKWIQQGCRI